MNFIRYFTKRRIYRWGMLITAILAILIAFITFYGQNSGNFVISLDDDAYRKGIILAKDADFRAYSARLLSNAIEEVDEFTYDWLNIPDAIATDGNYNDPLFRGQYLSYTFYLKNAGTETINVNMDLDITLEFKNVSKAIRVLIIEDGEKETMYMAPDVVEHQYPDNFPTTRLFVNDTKVLEEKIIAFRPTQVKKYTILMWLEGEDPECNDLDPETSILGGKIKMQMTFNILNIEEEGGN